METKEKLKHEVKCNNCKWLGMADDLKIVVKEVERADGVKDSYLYVNCPTCNDWEGIQDCE